MKVFFHVPALTQFLPALSHILASCMARLASDLTDQLDLVTVMLAARPGPLDMDCPAGIYVVVQKCIDASALLIAINRYRPCKLSPPSVPRPSRRGVTYIKRDHPVRSVGARTVIGGSYENKGVQHAIHPPQDVEMILE